MSSIGPNDGPVAVTGAAGYIGSHIVLTLIKHGYQVRACVRDASRLSNVAHLSLMNSIGPGSVSLYSCDMTIPGIYDDVFKGCIGIFHAAAEMGNLAGSTPQKVYDGGLLATQMLMESIKKARTVKRLVYTSSFAAVSNPHNNEPFTEESWADMNQDMRPPEKAWTMEVVAKDREIAYAMTKVDSERFVYKAAQENDFEAFGVCPCHVIGPLLSKTHMRPWTWQTRVGDMMSGYGHPRMFWNITDVRDVAEAQRLIAECPENSNGDRYNLCAADESGTLTQPEVQAHLQKLYPGIGVAGNWRDGKFRRGPIAFLQKVVSQLGLKPYRVEQTLKDNVDSLLSWGLIETREGVENWQREGNELGLSSKWSPHEYPALSTAQRA